MINEPPAIKDEFKAHPIAGAWRSVLCEIVHCFVAGDFGLAKGVAGVEPLSADLAGRMAAYVANYGATLLDLPPETWETSVAQWYGTHWGILVDLWTLEEGRSDLVLDARVVESEDGPRFSVHLVYVP